MEPPPWRSDGCDEADQGPLSFSTLGTLLVIAAVICAGCASNQQHPSPVVYEEVSEDSSKTVPNPDLPIPEPQNDPLENPEIIKDPLEPVNEKSFNVNPGLDQRAFRPVANVWIKITPSPAHKCISRFFENAGVFPRFTNALFQLRFKWAGSELARFGINSTIGIAGLFDPADKWFGLKEHDNNFAMTLARYGIGRGWYLVPPVGQPFDVRRAIGGAVDSLMNPMNYLVPGSATVYSSLAHGIDGLNSRAEGQGNIDDVHRFSIDEYGAVQNAYVQQQKRKEDALRNPE
jgi:phospholipid-binding lipoprotein MlaA